MKKGLFGCDLKAQVFLIGVTYCALSLIGIIFGFIMLQNPARFTNSHILSGDAKEENTPFNESYTTETTIQFEVSTDTVITETDGMGDSSEEEGDSSEEDDYENYHVVSTEEEYSDELSVLDGDVSESILEYSDDFNSSRVKRDVDEEDYTQENSTEVTGNDENQGDKKRPQENKHYIIMLRYLENEGIEAIIASFLKLVCSILLIHGVRSGKHWFLVPWLVEECVEMIGSFVHILVHVGRSGRWSIATLLVTFVCYTLGSYFLYSVASFHSLLKRMNKNSDQIISSVSGGFQVGRNYHRLEEDVWQSEPNIASEIGEGRIGANKFGRPGMESFTREKKVDLAEDNDEHVLYVQ